MRVEQPAGTRGSLKWMQRLVQHHPGALDEQLRRLSVLEDRRSLVWLSPLEEDSYAEYRDKEFLDRIGQGHLASELKEFWPRRGPQWDGLATDGGKALFLFEAKAHAAEMASTCQAGTESKRKIITACDTAKRVLGAISESDWLTGYYQYANRLAHLCFLRRYEVEARLVFLYFTGDADMRGPNSESEWKPHIEAAHSHLGLRGHADWVVSAFLPTTELA